MHLKRLALALLAAFLLPLAAYSSDIEAGIDLELQQIADDYAKDMSKAVTEDEMDDATDAYYANLEGLRDDLWGTVADVYADDDNVFSSLLDLNEAFDNLRGALMDRQAGDGEDDNVSPIPALLAGSDNLYTQIKMYQSLLENELIPEADQDEETTPAVEAAAAAPAAETAEGQAGKEAPYERVVFQGTGEGGSVGVFAPENPEKDGKYLSFRFLPETREEGKMVRLKQNIGAGPDDVKGMAIGYNGGDLSHLRFVDGNTDYVVYSGSAKFGDDDTVSEKHGLAIFRDGKLIENIDMSDEHDSEIGSEFFAEADIPNDLKDFKLPTAGDVEPETWRKRNIDSRWNITARYPEFGNAPLDSNIQAWLNKHIADNVTVQDLAGAPEDLRDSVRMDYDYTVTRPSPKVVSIAYKAMINPRHAAHPSTRVHVLNYATADGRMLTLNQLFRDPDMALDILSKRSQALIDQELRAQYPDAFKLANGQARDRHPDIFPKGFDPKRENFGSLGLESQGVRVYLQQYQILPYYYGLKEVLVPLADLAPAGPSTEVWPPRK